MSLTSRLTSDRCPRCRKELDAATSIEDYCAPKPQDLTVCIKCATILQWNKDMRLEIADLNKLNLPLPQLLELAKVVAAIRHVGPRYRHHVN
jgi:hypothetical protein